jgi:hypothetical protein
MHCIDELRPSVTVTKEPVVAHCQHITHHLADLATTQVGSEPAYTLHHIKSCNDCNQAFPRLLNYTTTAQAELET